MDALKPYKIDAKYINLINSYLQGTPISQLTELYATSEDEIASILNRKEVRNYISTQLQNYGYLNPLSRLNLINRMIEQKIELAEETETPLTKKDMVDLIKLLQQEQTMLQKSTQPEEQSINVNYLKLVQELVDD